MFYGKNKGCEFLHGQCVNTDIREFCDPKSFAYCSYSFQNKAFCRSNDDLSDGCSYLTPYGNSNCQDNSSTFKENSRGETWGLESRCVIGSVLEKKYPERQMDVSLCYKFKCADSKVIFYPNNGSEIICSSKGEKVLASGNYKVYLICPDPSEYCRDYYHECPNSCSFRGYCNDGTCVCRAG